MNEMRYIITKYKDGVLSFALDTKDSKMESVVFTHSNENINDAKIGDIFVAKVKNVAKQINAAFIDYAPNQKGYLPINTEYVPIITNRQYDGRILAGDEILVQLEKEAVRTKEPVFTVNLSLAGKYSVVSYANTYKGVSRKCTKLEREQLRTAIPQEINYGVVIRTNAVSLLHTSDADDTKSKLSFHLCNTSRTEVMANISPLTMSSAKTESIEALQPIKDEIKYLNDKMSSLIHDGIHRTCYSRIWKAAPSYLTTMRDEGIMYQQIITDDAQIYGEVKDFAALYMPEQIANISLYQDDSYPLHKLYRVETQLDELLAKKVWLKSGAYLVIEKTEAMYVIDVNSGKNIAKKANTEYIYQINMEAANEIMRQIRLRNLTGMILVDFINMDDVEKENALLQELRVLAKKDHILTTIVDITALGLVEITRKKTTKSLAEQLYH
ncbi:MAG: ribonuclease E/G [Lachnospiraceae bacterium]|nr:ribonuclease E/G [Lachnospiraceae bacterium]MDE7202968.1 ribonuclease E/G [Lachnospiraceae bacterium]